MLMTKACMSLVMSDAADDAWKAPKILRALANQDKPRIVSLYTELTTLEALTKGRVELLLITSFGLRRLY